MTWQGERRKQLPTDWAQRRAARLALDGNQCTYIGATGYRCPARATDVHHAIAGNDHRIESLRSLCDLHHKAETQREAQQARGVGILRRRPRRPHPGLR